MNILKKWARGFLALCLISGFSVSGAYDLVAGQNESGEIKVTILYDNYLASKGTKEDWGFACLIEGTEKTILFDTGASADILWQNINALKVPINKIEQIVISHNHADHTGGLVSILEKKKNLTVYLPASVHADFVKRVKEKGSLAVRVSAPSEICKNVFVSGEMGDLIKEQSLILDTRKGLVIVTGCAHPGIVEIVKKSIERFKKKVYFVFGGFHLLNNTEGEVKEIISELKALGVTKCGATHCTGDKAIQLFKDAYGENYVSLGVGKVITLPD